VRTVVGDRFTAVTGETRQTVARVASLAAVTARRPIATRTVVGAEV